VGGWEQGNSTSTSIYPVLVWIVLVGNE
jgi:hypothetical protein